MLLGRSVHPHRCGETWIKSASFKCGNGSPPQVWGNPYARSAPIPPIGSPPQVWGNQTCPICGKTYIRFTPTGVGKPENTPCVRYTQTVHPHRCGETFVDNAINIDDSGSPPQVWGNRRPPPARPMPGWFTPTGVGKPPKEELNADDPEVHPHRCGETSSGRCWRHSTDGSPPQVWGNRRRAWRSLRRGRFTPTGVGKPQTLYERAP